MTEVHEAVKALKGRLADTDGGFLTDVEVSRQFLRTLVEYAEGHLTDEPVRPFKLGDKVQEICDDIGDDKPVGIVVEMTELGQHVKLENTRHAGRKLFYYDEEIEPFGTTPEPTFGLHQKVELTVETSFMGTPLPKGKQGTIIQAYGPNEHHHEYEVAFSDENGSWSLAFDSHELKAVV